MHNDNFPFALADITGWVIRRKNGVTTKYNLVTPDDLARQSATKGTTQHKPGGWHWSSMGYKGGKTSYSQWCDHEPHPEKGFPEVFAAEGISIWIGDNPGASKCYKEFDICIDGGNVLSVSGEHDLPVLYGDPGLRNKLQRYLTNRPSKAEVGGPRILKIRWPDRGVPPVLPGFWPALLDELRSARDKGGHTEANPLRVMTICQGGHGRSGSAAAALAMCLSDYTPLDALTHIRAIHCARAIESKDQHEYLNLLAAHLDRDQNALEAEGVPSFKERLKKMTSKWAAPYVKRLEDGTGAKVEKREGVYL